jgi:hypothetical protein
MATNPLTRQEVIRRFNELTSVSPEELSNWLRHERRGRDPEERDPGDHQPAEVFARLKRKPPSEIDDEDVHHMSTLVNYLEEHRK